ncbi:MAG: PilZ domain-containing protein [Anaerolineaceae bacterium]|nr:hypothetical protein [Anaerolineaceae bacterium]
MLTSDCVTTIALEGASDELTSIIQKERVVDVEIPIKGLMLRESVVVCDCSPDQVEAQSSNISHFCTGNFNYPLFIKLSRTNKALSCRLSDLLVYSGKLILNDFRLMDQSWIDRQSDRVQPRLPIFVSVVNGKKVIKANLFDISITGICILFDKKNVEDPDTLLDSKLQILLTLPTYKSACKITGHVVQCRHIGNNLLRIGMDITMGNKDRAIIAHYLSERKREILDELFLNFTGLLNYRETKDQYF